MYPTFDNDDFSTHNDEDFSKVFDETRPISDREVKAFKRQLNSLPNAKKTILIKLGIASLAIGLLMQVLFSVNSASKEAQQQSQVIQEAPLYQKDQELLQAEANLQTAQLAYQKVLLEWNYQSPVNPNAAGTLQSSMLNASVEIRRRVEQLTRNRDSSNYGKNYLSALFSSLLTHRKTLTDPYLRGQIKEATLIVKYSDGTTSEQYMSAEEVAAWSSLKDIMYFQTLEPVIYNMDLDEKLRIKKQLEDKFAAYLLQVEGLKGTLNPETVMHDINHPWLNEIWNTEIAPTIDEDVQNESLN